MHMQYMQCMQCMQYMQYMQHTCNALPLVGGGEACGGGGGSEGSGEGGRGGGVPEIVRAGRGFKRGSRRWW